MRKYLSFPILAVSLLALTILLSGCPKKDEEDPFTSDRLTWVDGTFKFTSASFQEVIDFDGEGPMAPTDDALLLLYDIFNIYLECSSFEPVFEFTEDLKFNHYCKETGQSRQLGLYSFLAGPPITRITITLSEWNDPANILAPQTDLTLIIEQTSKTDDLWNLQGNGGIRLEIDPGKQTLFNFELQQVVIE